MIGGNAAGEHLMLTSTAHGTKGYIKLYDDLQLLSNIIRDSGATARVTLATSSPHVSLTGDLDVSGHGAIGSDAVPMAANVLRVVETSDAPVHIGGYFLVHGNRAAAGQATYGVAGGAFGEGTPSSSMVAGLYYFAQHNSASPCTHLVGIYTMVQSGASGTGALAVARAIYAAVSYWGGSKPATVIGLDIEEQGHASAGVAEGLHIDDQTAVTVRLLELGPAVPYLRLVGGANPAANESNLSLKFGATLKQVTEYDADSASAGYRALRVPN